MIVPDLNLLIYAHNDDSPHHEPAKRWWEGLLKGTEPGRRPDAISIGFVRLMTNLRVLVHPVSTDEATRHMLNMVPLPGPSLEQSSLRSANAGRPSLYLPDLSRMVFRLRTLHHEFRS